MPLKPPGWKGYPRAASPICMPPIVRNRRRGDPVLDIRISGLDRLAILHTHRDSCSISMRDILPVPEPFLWSRGDREGEPRLTPPPSCALVLLAPRPPPTRSSLTPPRTPRRARGAVGECR